MNTHQNRFVTARANLITVLEAAQATYPAEPAEGASDDAWMAYYEKTEDCDAVAGVSKARNDLRDAENALIAWGKGTAAAKESGLDFDAAARILSFRDRILDILVRV